MLKKISSYGVVILLGLALVGGSIYILARPENTEAANQELVHETSDGEGRNQAQGQADHVDDDNNVEHGQTNHETDDSGLDHGETDRTGNGSNQGQSDHANDGNGSGQGNESLYSDGTMIAFETIEGPVTESGNELLVATETGEVLVGLGPEFYREEAGFTVDVGDQVSVTGYLEEGEFKAATVENLSSNTSIVLRDETGRPMWSGQGNQKNQQ